MMMVCEAMYVEHVTGYAGVVKYVLHYMKGIQICLLLLMMSGAIFC